MWRCLGRMRGRCCWGSWCLTRVRLLVGGGLSPGSGLVREEGVRGVAVGMYESPSRFLAGAGSFLCLERLEGEA